MKITEDLEWTLLRGSPIFVSSAGNVYPFKLGEIEQVGYSIYNSIIYVLFNGNKSPKDKVFEDVFDNCIKDVQYAQLAMFSLEKLFKAKIKFECGFFSIIHENENGVLSKENYNEFLDAVTLQFCIKFDEQSYNPANEKAREMIERLNKGKAKKPSVKNDGTLIRLISGLANKSLQYNYFNIWDLTIYQLHDACNKIGILDDIYYTLLGYYTGNIRKEDIDFKKLDWTNKPNPLTE